MEVSSIKNSCLHNFRGTNKLCSNCFLYEKLTDVSAYKLLHVYYTACVCMGQLYSMCMCVYGAAIQHVCACTGQLYSMRVYGAAIQHVCACTGQLYSMRVYGAAIQHACVRGSYTACVCTGQLYSMYVCVRGSM